MDLDGHDNGSGAASSTNGVNGHGHNLPVIEVTAEVVPEVPATKAATEAPEAPAGESAFPNVEFPDDLEPLPQVFLYDDDANGRRPVRMACLDVRDLGGGLVVVVGKIFAPTRIRRLPDGEVLEAPAKSLIAVPVVSDLIQIPYEMASRPDAVLEVWFWPIPGQQREIAPGLVIPRYAVKGGWIENMTKKDLL